MLKKLKDFYNKDLQNKLITVFISVMALSFFLLIISLAVSFEKTIDFLSPFAKFSFFSDFLFIKHISLQNNPYIPGNNFMETSYPPFSLLIMKIFSFMPDTISIIILHYGVLILCFIILYKLFRNLKRSIRIILLIFLFLSLPFIYIYERANIVTWSLLFLLLFIYLYNKKNKFLKELSYICLAASFSIKIYPIIFIIIIFMDKNIYGFLRCILYSLILFFVPYIFFEGGFNNIVIFYDNFMYFIEDSAYTNNLNLSFNNFIRLIVIFYNNSYILSDIVNIVASILSFVLLILGVTASFFQKKKYRIIELFCVLMLLVPSVSFQYTIIFMSIAFVSFINEPVKTKKNILGLICYILIFLSVPIGYILPMKGNAIANWGAALTVNTVLQMAGLLILALINISYGFKTMIILKKNKCLYKFIKGKFNFKNKENDISFSDNIL